MSLNSLPIDRSSCELYDGTSNTKSNPRIDNCQSLRVNFRMVTQQSSATQNNYKLTTSMSQQNMRQSVQCHMPHERHNTQKYNFNRHNDHYPYARRNHHRMEYREMNIEEKTVCYDTYEESIPINIGTAPLPTTKTFQLTEDLKSNIKLDITLKPNLSLRDNRLNGAKSNLDLKQIKNSEENDLKVARVSRQRDGMVTRYYQTMPDTASSLIRLTFNGEPGSNKKIYINSYRSSNESNNNSRSSPPVKDRMTSPFTYIETFSTRRKASLSPGCFDMNKA